MTVNECFYESLFPMCDKNSHSHLHYRTEFRNNDNNSDLSNFALILAEEENITKTVFQINTQQHNDSKSYSKNNKEQKTHIKFQKLSCSEKLSRTYFSIFSCYLQCKNVAESHQNKAT